jgi:hypothetical protein
MSLSQTSPQSTNQEQGSQFGRDGVESLTSSGSSVETLDPAAIIQQASASAELATGLVSTAADIGTLANILDDAGKFSAVASKAGTVGTIIAATTTTVTSIHERYDALGENASVSDKVEAISTGANTGLLSSGAQFLSGGLSGDAVGKLAEGGEAALEESGLNKYTDALPGAAKSVAHTIAGFADGDTRQKASEATALGQLVKATGDAQEFADKTKADLAVDIDYTSVRKEIANLVPPQLINFKHLNSVSIEGSAGVSDSENSVDKKLAALGVDSFEDPKNLAKYLDKHKQQALNAKEGRSFSEKIKDAAIATVMGEESTSYGRELAENASARKELASYTKALSKYEKAVDTAIVAHFKQAGVENPTGEQMAAAKEQIVSSQAEYLAKKQGAAESQDRGLAMKDSPSKEMENAMQMVKMAAKENPFNIGQLTAATSTDANMDAASGLTKGAVRQQSAGVAV